MEWLFVTLILHKILWCYHSNETSLKGQNVSIDLFSNFLKFYGKNLNFSLNFFGHYYVWRVRLVFICLGSLRLSESLLFPENFVDLWKVGMIDIPHCLGWLRLSQDKHISGLCEGLCTYLAYEKLSLFCWDVTVCWAIIIFAWSQLFRCNPSPHRITETPFEQCANDKLRASLWKQT